MTTQGALWVYEALLSPTLKLARKELTKFPALEKAIYSIDRSGPVVVSLTTLVRQRNLTTEGLSICSKATAKHLIFGCWRVFASPLHWPDCLPTCSQLQLLQRAFGSL